MCGVCACVYISRQYLRMLRTNNWRIDILQRQTQNVQMPKGQQTNKQEKIIMVKYKIKESRKRWDEFSGFTFQQLVTLTNHSCLSSSVSASAHAYGRHSQQERMTVSGEAYTLTDGNNNSNNSSKNTNKQKNLQKKKPKTMENLTVGRNSI